MKLSLAERDWIDPIRVLRAAQPGEGLAFLDSGGDDHALARWSAIAIDPLGTVTGRVGKGRARGAPAGEPFRAVEDLYERWGGDAVPVGADATGSGARADDRDGRSREAGAVGAAGAIAAGPPFTGGVIAALGYDLGRALEHLPATASDDPVVPDLWAAAYDGAIVFDRVERKIWISDWGHDARRAREREDLLARARAASGEGSEDSPVRTPQNGGEDRQSVRARFMEGVEAIREEILRGEIYQANLTRRVERAVPPGSGRRLYQTLRRLSPTPFGAYLDAGSFQILSASPERFVRTAGAAIETRPIKGTRPRGSTPEEDARLSAELLASEKDLAELLMIVDLERNDLGRVCETGSIAVEGFPTLERYSSVWHLVATVRGRIEPGRRMGEILGAVFPGGSITGAPKIRAMEILDRMEARRRKFSMGSLVAWDFGGGLDSSILIRTMTLCGGRAFFDVGGGIVFDSDPGAEYDETVAKAGPLVGALDSL